LLSIALVSVNAAGTASGNSDSTLYVDSNASNQGNPSGGIETTSADGHLMAFQSDATDLVAGVYDSNKASDVFVRNLQTGATELVSATPGGNVGNNSSFDPIISPNGRYVAFLSDATNLSSVAAGAPQTGGNPTYGYLYVRDLETQTTTLLDVGQNGKAANGVATGTYVFSPDSTSLAFADTSTNLTSTPPSLIPPNYYYGSPPTNDNVYVYNLAAGTTTAVSVTPEGTLSQGNNTESGVSDNLVFSPDGTMLAYTSTAVDLVADDQNNTPGPASNQGSSYNSFPTVSNVFVSDLATGTTTPISLTPAGLVGDGTSSLPVFSPDGTQVAFLSTSSNLTADPPGNSAGNTNLFVRNLTTQTTTLASVTTAGTLSSGDISEMAFSPDGQSLAFASTGTDLTANAVDPAPPTSLEAQGFTGATNIFVRNLSAGTTTAVSVTPDGLLSYGTNVGLTYSPDGQSLAYLSDATDLTANPYTPPPAPPTSPPIPTATTTSTTATSVTATPLLPQAGVIPSAPPYVPPTILNNLFLTNLGTGATTLVTVTPSGQLSNSDVGSFVFSPDGSQLAFSDSATDLTNNPPQAAPASSSADNPYPIYGIDLSNIFVRDLPARTTTLITAAADGTLMSDPSFSQPSPLVFSPDGQTLYFMYDNPLVASDTNGVSDIYAATAPFATPGEIDFASWQFSADESDGQAVITVVRNAPLAAAASVDYSVQDATAMAGTDYQATSGTVNFAAGQSSATFSIPLYPADSFTGTQSATITLSNPTGGTVGVPTATLNLTSMTQTPTPTVTVTPTPTDGSVTAPTPTPTDGSTTTPTATPAPTPTATTTPTPTPTPSATTTPTPTPSATTTPTPTPTPSATTTPTPTPTPTATTTPTPTPAATTTPTPTPTPAATTTPTPTPTPAATPTPTPTPTPTKTATPTPTPAPTVSAQSAASTPTTPTVVGNSAGPVVSGVTLQKTGHKITGLAIHFNKPLASSSAGNVANYAVRLLSLGRRNLYGERSIKNGKAVRVSAVQYDPNTQVVTLSFHPRLAASQMFQLQVIGGPGGITDASGDALNSPSRGVSGSDYLYTAN